MERPKGTGQTARAARRVIVLAAILGSFVNGLGLAHADPPKKSWASDVYGRLPLSFETNRGQVSDEVQFLSRGDGYSLFLAHGDAVMVFRRTRHERPAASRRGQPAERSVLRMQLVGADKEARAAGLDELPGRANYFIGSDPTRWRTNLPTFAKVRYERVYPGVDLVYYGNQGRLEYDLIVAPGADPRVITLAFQGAKRIEQDASGDLLISSDAGVLRQQKPVIYQEIDGTRRPVPGRYVLKSGNQVGFDVGAYDTAHPLVIDPTLVYSTYVSGSADTFIYSVAVDHSGNAYITGCTTSTDFPTTKDSFQSDFQSNNPVPPDFVQPNAFVAKLNPAGSALVYSTYLGGGTDLACGSGITVDSSGNAFVTGLTGLDFPITPGAFRTTPREDIDAFVVKLNGDGSALLYSTYLGGQFPTLNNSAEDDGSAIAVDAAGNAYIAGRTRSTDFPTTPGAFQTSFHGRFAGFVAKMNPQGSALVYSTYLGDPAPVDVNHDFTVIWGLAVDPTGHAYVVGRTSSPNFPTTTGAFQTTFGGGEFDAFVTKLSPDGSSLVYSTYLGGHGICADRFASCFGNEEALAVAIDASGHAYVTGTTDSINFPIVGPIAQKPTLPSVSAFVSKLSPDGKSLLYSTYLGGGGARFDQPVVTSGNAIAVDAAGNAYVAGSTQFDAFPTTQGAFRTTYAGGDSDVFVTKLDPTGAVLLYSTLLGGSFGDEANAIALDAGGNAYVAGTTGTGALSCPVDTQDAFPPNDFPATPGAFQAHQAGLTFCLGPSTTQRPVSGFVARFALPESVVPLQLLHFPDTLPALPTASVGAPYVGNIGIGGGRPPYAILLAGGAPPAGLGFTPPGVALASSVVGVGAGTDSPIITGVPTQCGTSEFAVSVQDGSSGAVGGTLAIKVDASGHNHTITSKTGGTPDPVASSGTVAVSTTVLDSFAKAVQYAWTASCSSLSTSGSFNNATAHNPTWTAPVNATGVEQVCVLQAAVTDGDCVSHVTFLQRVSPIPGGPQFQTLAAAILPVSRSVQVGATATAFVSIVNSGSATATAVGIGLASQIPAQFSYQTTDPQTNQLTGSPNTPVNIPAGQRQSYVISLTPNQTIPPTDVAFNFAGTNTSPVAPLPGINTLLFSASPTPVPDVVAQAATLTGNGIVVIPGVNGTGVFAVATANQGASGAITVSADSSAAVSIALCRTDPATGVCISAVGATVTLQIGAGETPTFGVFVAGQGAAVPFDPAHNRVFVRFRDAGGIERGATSVAVRTQ